MATLGTVRDWTDDEGWGVIDSSATPGGCWTHFSHLAVPGYRTLRAGQVVEMEWETPNAREMRLFSGFSGACSDLLVVYGG